MLFNEKSRTAESDTQTQFQADYEYIIQTYAHELPPPAQELEYCIVVPAYKELSHLLKLLESLTTQKDSTIPKIEVLYVVNNTQESAKKKTAGFVDNQETLRLIQYIHTHIMNDSPVVGPALISQEFPLLTPHQHKVIAQSIQKKITIHGVDASTHGIDESSYAQKPGNYIGLGRLIGGCLATKRMGRSQTKWIDFLDDDCFLPSGYLTKMLQKVSTNETQAYFKPLYVVPELPDDVVELPESLFKVATMCGLIKSSFIAQLQFLGRYFALQTGPAPVTTTAHFCKIYG